MGDEDFLSRWSRRKRDPAAEDSEHAAAAIPVDVAEVPEPASEAEEAALLKELGLPLPESLRAGDDFSIFMTKGVPQFLRRRALRVLWRTNPVLANLDGLNDYDDDFTSPELTKKVLATAYQVGRGFVSQIVEPEAAEVSEVREPSEQPPGEERIVPGEREKIHEETDHSADPVEDAAEDNKPENPARPRRMRFET
ncbi:MAG: DUF3306 domain-containing protein [Silicimonas sp.]|nr:DUF3306 domain-containing protein [Silicimonas sp.]